MLSLDVKRGGNFLSLYFAIFPACARIEVDITMIIMLYLSKNTILGLNTKNTYLFSLQRKDSSHIVSYRVALLSRCVNPIALFFVIHIWHRVYRRAIYDNAILAFVLYMYLLTRISTQVIVMILYVFSFFIHRESIWMIDLWMVQTSWDPISPKWPIWISGEKFDYCAIR